jgi:hypothetical protein
LQEFCDKMYLKHFDFYDDFFVAERCFFFEKSFF